MEQITLYIAEDGKTFNNEESCREYEMNLLKPDKNLAVLSKNNLCIRLTPYSYATGKALFIGKAGLKPFRNFIEHYYSNDSEQKYYIIQCINKTGIWLESKADSNIYYNLFDKRQMHPLSDNEIEIYSFYKNFVTAIDE